MLEFFRRGGDDGLAEIKHKITEMVVTGRELFLVATGTVFGEVDVKEVRKDVKARDREVNRTEQEVRRDLLVHIAVAGPTDVPAVLAYMSVVKDAERIGDYAKNIMDLARYGASFVGAGDEAELAAYRYQIADLIGATGRVFAESDQEAAREQIAAADELLDEFDDHVIAAMQSSAPAGDSVARALYFRYLKRIVAHLTNLVSALVLPVDRLDYYDEAKGDRD